MGSRRSRVVFFAALAMLGAVLAVVSALGSGQRALAQDGGAENESSGVAYLFELDDAISPATSSWVSTALSDAEEAGAEVAILRLDTPGGLDSSTREIVQEIISAPMPVAVYVAPDGARAASAGAFITQAADVAAMAPGTNIGSASPISIGPGEQDEVLGRKITNDAAAYIRALAESHGRNPELGEEMVTEATNVTAEEALEANFIDFVADTPSRLLEKMDGFEVQGPKAQTLNTSGLEITEHEMPFGYEALGVIVNPTMAFLLLTVGLIGIAIEIFSPGLIFPGALGAISFLLGLYGTAQLPVTWVGVLLLVAAIALLVAEGQIGGTFGALGVPGIIALVLSGLLLFNSDEGAEVSVPVVVTVAILLGVSIIFAIRKVNEARERPVMTGSEELIGAEAEVRVPVAPIGQVFVEGAIWRAESAEPEARFGRGDKVRVEAVDGLTLRVARLTSPSNEEVDKGVS